MRRPKVATVLVLAVAATLMLGVVPATATISGVSVDDYTVVNGRVVEIEGHISCTPGQQFLLRVNVTDDSGNKAVGRASGQCSVNGIINGGNGNGGVHWETGRVDSETGFTQDECLVARGQARTSDGDIRRIRDFVGGCG